MKRIDSTKTKWRVQVRKSRENKWQNKGLFEVRWMARTEAAYQRDNICRWIDIPEGGYGFGNTRVVRHPAL